MRKGRLGGNMMGIYDWSVYSVFSEEDFKETEDYSEEERDAMSHPEHMTQALFEKCLSTSVRLDDFECYFRLIGEFPDFSDVYDRKIELLIKHSIEPPVF